MSWRLESRAPGTEDRRASVQGTWVWGRHEQNAAGMDHGGGNEMEEVVSPAMNWDEGASWGLLLGSLEESPIPLVSRHMDTGSCLSCLPLLPSKSPLVQT